MICPKCNKTEGFLDLESHGAKASICKCGYIIQTQQSDEYDKFCSEQQQMREQQSSKPTITCPYCQSTNTKKITNTSKAVHTAIFGIWSMGRNSKQWHCNSCGSDF